MAIGCSSSNESPGNQAPAFNWDGGPNNNGGGTGGFGGAGGPPPATCTGNNVIDAPAEQCDGPVPNGMTCATVTMGSLPQGNLKCTACQIDTSGCSSNGTFNTGGAGGGGGGGGIGTGGGSGVGGDNAQGGSGSGGVGTVGGDTPTHLPTASGTCPPMSNLNGTAVTFGGQPFSVWSGDPSKGPGPLLVYWFATGSNSTEPTWAIGQAQITRITGLGGAIVAMQKTTTQGSNTGDNVWYTGDVDIADQAVACAIQSQKIDPRRIHVAGYSAGGLQTTYQWFARSGYVASVLTYSGGDTFINKTTMQDPGHVPPALVTHGGAGKDTFAGVIDFASTSATWETDIKGMNGFAIDCDDGGTHTDIANRTKIAPQAVQFFLDHPYGVKPEPYTAIPAGWPSYCVIK